MEFRARSCLRRSAHKYVKCGWCLHYGSNPQSNFSTRKLGKNEKREQVGHYLLTNCGSAMEKHTANVNKIAAIQCGNVCQAADRRENWGKWGKWGKWEFPRTKGFPNSSKKQQTPTANKNVQIKLKQAAATRVIY